MSLGRDAGRAWAFFVIVVAKEMAASRPMVFSGSAGFSFLARARSGVSSCSWSVLERFCWQVSGVGLVSVMAKKEAAAAETCLDMRRLDIFGGSLASGIVGVSGRLLRMAARLS